jgi:hypothetical protein
MISDDNPTYRIIQVDQSYSQKPSVDAPALKRQKLDVVSVKIIGRSDLANLGPAQGVNDLTASNSGTTLEGKVMAQALHMYSPVSVSMDA